MTPLSNSRKASVLTRRWMLLLAIGATGTSVVRPWHEALNAQAIGAQASIMEGDALSRLQQARESLGGARQLDQVLALEISGTREIRGSQGLGDVANRLESLASGPFTWRLRLDDETGDAAAAGGSVSERHAGPTDDDLALLLLCRLRRARVASLRAVEPSAATGLTGEGIQVRQTDGTERILVLDRVTNRPRGLARRLIAPKGSSDPRWYVLRVRAYATDAGVGIVFPRLLTEHVAASVETLRVARVELRTGFAP